MKTKKVLSIVALLILGATTVSYASIDKNLKYGQKDKEVIELQQFLITKGLLKATPSTYFGALTLKAVKAYQLSVNLSPTGFVGALTREKINKEIETEVASSNQAEKAEASTSPVTTKVKTQSVVVSTNTSINDDSIYDSNTKTDSLGRKIIITQDPNYKFLSIVRAKVEVSGKIVEGFFNKNTKIFAPESTNVSIVNTPSQETIQQTDYCKNIEGAQTKVPDNMLVGNDGVCFTKQTVVVTPAVNGVTTYVAPVEQPKPFTRLTVRYFEGKLYIESSKDIDFSSITFTRPVCVPLPVSGCVDWVNTLTIPITVNMLERKVYEADASQSRNYIASLSNNNFRNYLTDDEKIIAKDKDIGYSLRMTVSSTDGVLKIFNGSAVMLKDGGFNLNF